MSQNPPKTLPKTLPNRYSKKHMIFERIFETIFQIQGLETLKICVSLRREHDVQGFRTKICFNIFLSLGFENPPQNPCKTRSEPLKNRCRKRVVFEHRFFTVSASILEGLGPPRWSQVGHFGLQKLGTAALLHPLKLSAV